MVKEKVLSVKNLWKVYGKGRGRNEAVKDISFDIFKEEFVALAGPSGSGKSTTFHQIALLDKPSSGDIEIKNQETTKLREEKKAEFRLDKIGYVFQNHQLLPELNAIENVVLPLMVREKDKTKLNKKGEEILKELGLSDRKNHLPSELSGGEKQRVAIGRALANNPDIILADEPTANLDSVASKNVMDIFKKLNRKQGITVFIVNHEKEFENYFDRVIRLRDGKIEEIDKK